MKKIILIALLCLLNSASADFYSDTKALAEGGVDFAQYNLGNMYANGRGVVQNDAEAAKWYRKAADQGYARGQAMLALMYRKGQGVPQNYIEAYVWNSIAAASGHELAIHNRDIIAMQLSLTDLEAAQKRAAKLYEEIQQRK